MDYDSSTKFISSLAKFLQSLCNGYVEFDNGVQVIGHLYLNVDTGKTIDYVLNEKVCKTDENSVTFISNSFHAQPAEKPKPPGKNRDADKSDLKSEVETVNHNEDRGSNGAALSSSRSQNSNSLHVGAKRPLTPSKQESVKSGRISPRHKKSRSLTDSNNSTNPENRECSSKDALNQHSLGHKTSSFNEYQQNLFTGDETSVSDDQEHRDIKPFDTDITFIKEEYAPSSLHSEHQVMQDDGIHGDNSSEYPHTYSNQQFHQEGYADDSSFNPNQRSAFNPAGFNSGNAQLEGCEVSNDPSDKSKNIEGCTKTSRRRSRKWNHHTSSFNRSSWSGPFPNSSQESGSIFEELKDPIISAVSSVERENLSNATTDEEGKDLAQFTVLVDEIGCFRYQCHHCENIYRDKRGIRRHLEIIGGKVSHQCEVCYKTFARNDVYKRHLRLVHGVFWSNSQDGDLYIST